MSRVLITGMSGAGKSTLLAELRRRGHRTVDTDYGGWVRPDGTWDEDRMARLLAGETPPSKDCRRRGKVWPGECGGHPAGEASRPSRSSTCT